MAQIFISYSRADRQFLDRFVPLLRKVYGNSSLWYDDDIHGGVDWWEMILRKIADCELFIYLVSNDALASPYCQAELREALRLKKQILPVVVRPKTQYPGPEVPDDLAEFLTRWQYVDMSKGFSDPIAIANLYAAINRLLETAPQTEPDPATPKPVLQPPVPDKKTSRWGNLSRESQVILIAAIIGFVGTIGAALIGVTANQSSVVQRPPATEISQEDNNIFKSTATSTPSDTPVPPNTPTATGTPDPLELALKRAREGVTSNTQWQEWYPDGFVREFDGVEMVLVPAGCFLMGSELPEADDDEQPEHERCIDEPFWIDRYEVSQAQFAAFGGEADSTNYFNRDDLPRESITRYEARSFCETRGGKIPTETEWEYAARGSEGYIYPWGNVLEPYKLSSSIVFADSSAISVNVASPRFTTEGMSWVGAYHMLGNVHEWTYTYYRNDYATEPDSSTTQMIVHRGGSFRDPASAMRFTNRFATMPDTSADNIGFRCVRYAP